MRLIDSDMLKAIISNTYYKPHEVIGIINRRPTVEAIPKEWIRDYMLRLPDGNAAYECILVMLEDWEKENETN